MGEEALVFSREIVSTLAITLLATTGSILLALLILVLRFYEVFHKNLRLLLANLLGCFLMSNIHLIVRGVLVPQRNHSAMTSNFPVNSSKFPESGMSALPTPFCVFICVTMVLTCMERLYATVNCQTYELEETFAPVLYSIYKAMWMVLVFFLVRDIYAEFTHSSRWQSSASTCEGLKLLLRIDGHLVLTTGFHIVFLVILILALKMNKEREEVYVRHYYNDLSQRFQIGENLKGVRLMVALVTMLTSSLLLALIVRYWWRVRAWKGVYLLIMPVFTVAFPIYTMWTSQIIRSRAKVMSRELLTTLLQPLRGVAFNKLTAAGGRIHNGDVLRDYWDDYLHLK